MRLGLEAGKDTHDLAVELGIRGVPISAGQLAGDGVDATLKPLAARGLEVCQIGAMMFNPLSTNIEAQAAQAEALKKVLPLAAETGCGYIVINGGNYHPSGYGAGDERNFTDAAIAAVAEALKPYLDAAARHDVKLSIEPYLKTVVHSPEAFLKLKAALGNPDALRCNIDVSSLYDYHDLWNPSAKVERVCKGLAGHYGLGHIKEVALLDGFHIHAGLAPLGQGRTDWSQVLGLMAPQMPNDSWVILEHVLSPDEARNSVNLLKETAAQAGVVLE